MSAYMGERHDERIGTDFENRRDAYHAHYMSEHFESIYSLARQVADKVGIPNKIFDVASDRSIHFEGTIPEREKRNAFEVEMLKKAGVHYKVVAFWH